jgi:glycosylphosphatidylinositol transamidase (GPIT) subunit GPI8
MHSLLTKRQMHTYKRICKGTVMQFFENIAIRPDGSSDRTLHDLFKTLRHANLKSNVGIQNHRFEKDLRDVPITDFFGSTIDVHVTNVGY